MHRCSVPTRTRSGTRLPIPSPHSPIPRSEGLVLHNLCYEDGGRLRPILHRLSAVEMAVPYADPNSPFTRKCAFDVGDCEWARRLAGGRAGGGCCCGQAERLRCTWQPAPG